MIEFVKFLDSTTHTMKVYFTKEKVLQESEPSFEFATAEEAVEKSLSNTVIFWDNQLIGTGKIAE